MNAWRKRISALLFGMLCGSTLFFVGGCQISGTVMMDGAAAEGVVVVLSGDAEQRAVTDQQGRYRFSDVDAGRYTVTLLAPEGYVRNPTMTVYKDSDRSDMTGNDFVIENSTTRTLTHGRAVGLLEDNGVAVWRGLPFAQPPVGPLRWQAPLPEQAWQDIYLAIQPGDECPQFAGMLSDLPRSEYGTVIGNEDCLYLNVWAPALSVDGEPEVMSGNQDLPVMFWIHGGGNTIGEGIQYNGKALAERYGVVVVTINYRLGPLGWLRHPALRTAQASAEDRSGNFGTLDIIRALTWVQENIAAFGGDKHNVMIFGESAGATNVLSMLASPLSEGLFHRAASQSGGIQWSTVAEAEHFADDAEPGDRRSSREVINDWLVLGGLAETREEATALQASMSDADIHQFLYQLTPSQLLAAYDGQFAGMFSAPRLFRDGVVLPDQAPLAVFDTGNYHQVPTILGTNRDENRLFMALDPNYTTTIANLIPIIKNKTDYLLSSRYLSDHWKIRGVDEIARAMEPHQEGSVYVYRFDWDEEMPLLGIGADILLGAAHILEVGFVFADANQFIVPSYQPFVYTLANQAGRESLSGAMSSYWAGFAAQGDPGNGFAGEQPQRWLPWRSSSEHKTFVFDTEQDQGIRMTDLYFDREELQAELESETGFSGAEAHCRVYGPLYGETAFYQAHCQ